MTVLTLRALRLVSYLDKVCQHSRRLEKGITRTNFARCWKFWLSEIICRCETERTHICSRFSAWRVHICSASDLMYAHQVSGSLPLSTHILAVCDTTLIFGGFAAHSITAIRSVPRPYSSRHFDKFVTELRTRCFRCLSLQSPDLQREASSHEAILRGTAQPFRGAPRKFSDAEKQAMWVLYACIDHILIFYISEFEDCQSFCGMICVEFQLVAANCQHAMAVGLSCMCLVDEKYTRY